MKKIGIWVLILILVASCGLIKQVPVNTTTETIYNYIDSLIFRDSVVLIPKYTVKDVVPFYDTLDLETDLAKAKAFVDTNTHTLKGEIQNKKEQQTKYIYKDRIIYRDSIRTVEKEVPVPVYVDKFKIPRWVYLIFGINFVIIAALVLYFLKKFTKIFG